MSAREGASPPELAAQDGLARTAGMDPEPMASATLEVKSYRLPQAWPASVDALLSDAQQLRISFGAGWYRHLVATSLSPGDAAWLHVLFVGGLAVAALPVMQAAGEPCVLAALSNFYTWLYEPVQAAQAPAQSLTLLVQAACRQAGRVQVLRFAPMDPAAASFQALAQALRANGLATFDYFCHGNWYLPVTKDWAGYLAERKSGLRSTIKRMDKRLQAAQGRIEILSAPADVARGIACFEQVYARSWKQPEPFPEFMPGLIRLCATEGWLRLGLVFVGEEPVAAQVWFVAHGRAEIYKVAYDEEHKALAPGTLLTARLIQYTMEQDQVREIDYLIGDDAYKSMWMNERRERWGLVAYNPRTVAGLWGWAREVGGRRWRAVQRRVKAWRNPAPD